MFQRTSFQFQVWSSQKKGQGDWTIQRAVYHLHAHSPLTRKTNERKRALQECNKGSKCQFLHSKNEEDKTHVIARTLNEVRGERPPSRRKREASNPSSVDSGWRPYAISCSRKRSKEVHNIKERGNDSHKDIHKTRDVTGSSM